MTEFSPEWQAEEQARRDRMAASGLYRAEDEHSSCGVGFVVDLDFSRRDWRQSSV